MIMEDYCLSHIERNNSMIKIPDIIQLNDWEPKKFLIMIAAIQLAMLGLIGMDWLGWEISILRQFVGFVYLTFIPGIIILKLLRLHRLGTVKTVLLSTGLSISFLMFIGFFINEILYFLNIDSPFSFWNVFIFITAILIILGILSCKIDRFDYFQQPTLEISRSAVYLILLPVLSIAGTYFIYYHKNNIFLLILIVLIALIPILVAFKKITSEVYPLAVTAIAVSLLFHTSLISPYLTGWDIHGEYYFHRLVVDNAYWNPVIENNLNAMLSIVILPTVYSYFLKMDGVWVFKIIYPIIFSLVPLGLYCVYLRHLKSDKMAFFSVFFSMSFIVFFKDMVYLARQEIAELFFVLLIFLMVQDTISKNIRNILLLIFGASLVTSHYGITYIFIILLIIVFLFSLDIVRNSKIKIVKLPGFNLKKTTLIYFVSFYIFFVLIWYINFSSSSVFESIVHIGDRVSTNFIADFSNFENRDKNILFGLGIADPVISSFGRYAHRNLQLITQFLIIIGFFKIIFYREYAQLKAEYFYLIAGSLVILLLSLLPHAANTMNMTRIYQISLLTLSPLFIVGGIFVIEKLLNIINNLNIYKQNLAIAILILGVLIPYFLFNTGFIYAVTNEYPTSISLDMEKMKNYDISKKQIYGTITQEQDVNSAIWYYKYKNTTKVIYADSDSQMHVLYSYGKTYIFTTKGINLITYLKNIKTVPGYYIYFNKFNICENNSIVNKSIYLTLLNTSSTIYSNGCGEIYEG